MKAKVTRRNIFLLSMPTLVVVIIAATLFWFFDRMKTADNLRMETTTGLNTAQKIVSLLAEAELGTRNYIQTNDVNFLQPYLDTSENIPTEIAELRSLKTTPAIKAQIEKLAAHSTKEIEFLAVAIADIGRFESDELMARFTKGEGVSRMSAIREVMQEYEQLQTKQLQTYRKDHRKYMEYLFGFIVLVSIFLLLFAQAFAYGIYRTIHQRLMNLVHQETQRSLDSHEAMNQQLNMAYFSVQDSERKLDVTLNSIADGVIATDCNANVTLMNYVAEQLTDTPIEDAQGKSICDIFHIVNKETLEPVLNPVLETLLHGIAQGASDNLFILPDGTEYNIAHSCAPIRDHDGQVIGAVLVFRNVTAENVAQQTLLDTTERIKTILDTVIDGIVTFNARTQVIESVNTATEKMFGYTAGELIGQNISLLVPDLNGESGALDYYQTSLEERSNGIFREAEGRQKNGQYLPMEIAANEMRLGGQRYLTCVLRNITARKHAEALMLESEYRYRNLFESIDEGFCVVEMIYENDKPIDQLFLELNPSFEKHTGFYHAKGKYLSDFIPDIVPDLFAVYDRVLKNGDPVRFEYQIPSLNTWFDIYCCRFGKPEMNRVAIVFSNITQRKNAEEALRESERHLRAVIDALPVAIYATDAEGSLTHFNQSAVEFSGCTPELGNDKWCRDLMLFHPDGAVMTYEECPMTVALREGRQLMGIEAMSERPDKSRINFVAHPTPIRDTTGKIVGSINMLVDITERKRLDQVLLENNLELNKAKNLAEKANRAKSDFLSNMSHELRTPLNAILGFAQLIDASNPPPTNSQKASVAQILQAGWYLLDLINEILDLTLIESGRLPVSMELVALPELMDECKAMVEPQALNRNITLNFPEFTTAFIVSADNTRLKQVLINLLSNAIKYNRPNGSVTVTCVETHRGRTRISVEDTGEGLSPEQLSQLFQPFNRLGKENSAEEGTGIGLVMTKRLIKLMGGKISVASTLGKGTVFSIELSMGIGLPTTIADIDGSPTQYPQLKQGETEFTLLYVEDNPANLALVEDIIATRPDFVLLTARDGFSGIELARFEQPDIILMDINLPGMSGTEALKVLAKDSLTNQIPVIALSANAMPRDIEKGLEAGFFRYLTKPIRINEFMSTLDAALALVSEKTTKLKKRIEHEIN